MSRWKDTTLNGLLAALVCLSLALSAQIWFPAPPSATGTPLARVQTPPPIQESPMPDIYRPERVLLRRANGAQAMVMTDSVPFRNAWFRVRQTLAEVAAKPTALDLEPIAHSGLDPEAASVTVFFSTQRAISNWASIWGWENFGLWYNDVRVDRMRIVITDKPWIEFSGPDGYYRLTGLTEDEVRPVFILVRDSSSDLFTSFRPLNLSSISTAKVQPGISVPDVNTVPVARLQGLHPEYATEEVRYFPDLSVVRQIDESTARAYTDGRRLLRITSTGVLEFRAPGPGTYEPRVEEALGVAEQWLQTRGGWLPDLLLSRVESRRDRVRLTFEQKTAWAYPVETINGAFVLEVTNDEVLLFQRNPDLTLVPEHESLAIITPEEAINLASESIGLLLYESIRDVYLSYRVACNPLNQNENVDSWTLEPSWVLTVGTDRIYVLADASIQRPTATQARHGAGRRC